MIIFSKSQIIISKHFFKQIFSSKRIWYFQSLNKYGWSLGNQKSFNYILLILGRSSVLLSIVIQLQNSKLGVSDFKFKVNLSLRTLKSTKLTF